MSVSKRYKSIKMGPVQAGPADPLMGDPKPKFKFKRCPACKNFVVEKPEVLVLTDKTIDEVELNKQILAVTKLVSRRRKNKDQTEYNLLSGVLALLIRIETGLDGVEVVEPLNRK